MSRSRIIRRSRHAETGTANAPLKHPPRQDIEYQADRITFLYIAQIVFGEIRLYPNIVYSDESHVGRAGLREIAAIHPHVTDQPIGGSDNHRAGKIEPGLLTDDEELAARIASHPWLQWKALL